MKTQSNETPSTGTPSKNVFSLPVTPSVPFDEPWRKAMLGVDLSRDALLTAFGIATLRDRYMTPTETSPQEAFMRACRAFADDESHALRLYGYVSSTWFMFATPVLANGGTGRGLPISCFLNYVPDSREGLTGHYTENAWLSSIGGGVGGYWGHVRSDGTATKHGSQSSGSIPFMKVVDAEVMAFTQGHTRRAAYAAYQDISHPEIPEFLEMRKPTGGDLNRKCLNLHHGVVISDAFMEIIERCMKEPDANDDWDLIDPHSKHIVETVSAKDLWTRILEMRIQTGEPYILFGDTVNRAMPEQQKKLGLKILQSNLCTEITLATNAERTAVCCLSSVNLEKYDEWANHPMFIEDLVRMLDNVLEFFIQRASAIGSGALSKAVYSAKMERSIGLGAMGFHNYLQNRMIPFESAMASSVNRRMFKLLADKSKAASQKLAEERGPCPDAQGEMIRNMHRIAIAPNASSSIMCGGTSPGIEPNMANAFLQKTDSGSFLVRNQALQRLLSEKGLDTEEIWQDIVLTKGSVQHLSCLSQNEKDVFKTAKELKQMWIIEHASVRQPYICQAQSINLFMPPDVDVRSLHIVHFAAWKQELKSLYYLRSESLRRGEAVSKDVAISGQPTLTTAPEVEKYSTCLSCEG